MSLTLFIDGELATAATFNTPLVQMLAAAGFATTGADFTGFAPANGAVLSPRITTSTLTSVGTLQSLALGGVLTFTPAVSQVVPGATSYSIRNNANNADNWIVTDAGNATLRGTLALNGLTYAWPAAQAADRFLRTDGAGNLTWALPLEDVGLADLKDVTITSPLTGQFLVKSAGDWVNHTFVTADVTDLTTAATGITKVGTVNTGVWQGTSIATTYTDAKIKTVTGTLNRLVIGGSATDPTFDISNAYIGQNTITTVGVLNTGSIASGFGGASFGGNVVATTDNTFDLGASAATRFRDLFLARNAVIGGTLAVSSATTITSTSTSSIAIGPAGATNPVWQVDASTVSQAAGLKLTGAIAAGTVDLSVISSGLNASLSINAKGTGTIAIGNVSTGAITLTPASTHTGLATFNGGATVANGQTLTLTGTMVAGAPTWSVTQTLNTSGNAATATALATARTIWGQNFDGTGNVSGALTGVSTVAASGVVTTSGLTISAAIGKIIPGATSVSYRNSADNADNLLISDAGAIAVRSTISGVTTLTATSVVAALTGNADTATKLATARTIAITGDLAYTSSAFDGSGNATASGTLATVNANVGAFGGSTAIPVFTVNGKGLITAASTAVVIAPAGTLTGATLASNVLASSLTSVGVLASPHLTSAVIDSGGLTITAGTLAAQTVTVAGTLTVNSSALSQLTATASAFTQIVATGSPVFAGQRANGTIAAPTAVANSDAILAVQAFGHDGTAYRLQGALEWDATQAWTGTARGNSVAIYVTSNNSTTLTQAQKWGQDLSSTFGGNLLWGTDNSFDIGASGASRARDLFLARNATIGGATVYPGVVIGAGAVSLNMNTHAVTDYSRSIYTTSVSDIQYFVHTSRGGAGAWKGGHRWDVQFSAGAEVIGLYLWHNGTRPVLQTGGDIIADTDAAYDVGASGANRFRDFFLARNATIGGTLAVSSDVSGRSAAYTNQALIPASRSATGPLTFSVSATSGGTSGNLCFQLGDSAGNWAWLKADASAVAMSLSNAGALAIGGTLAVTGTSQFTGNVGIGGASSTQRALFITSSVTATAGTGSGIRNAATVVAAANNDTLRSIHLSPTFTPGVFTGVTQVGLEIDNIAGGATNLAIRTNTGAVEFNDLTRAIRTGAGSLIALEMLHASNWSSGDEVRLDAGQATGAALGRLALYFEGAAKWGWKLYTSSASALNTNPTVTVANAAVTVNANLLAFSNNSFDIGDAGGANQFRDFWLARNASIAGTLTLSQSSASANTLVFSSTTVGTGIQFGDAVANLYRLGVGAIKTDSAFTVGGALTASSTIAATGAVTISFTSGASNSLILSGATLGTGLQIGDSTANLYRLAVGSLKTDGAWTVGGTSQLTGNVGIGVASNTNRAVIIGSSVSAASATATGLRNSVTLVAIANGDTLRGSFVAPTFTVGAFTGVTCTGIEINDITGGATNFALKTGLGLVSFGGATGINGKTPVTNVAAPTAAGATYTATEQALLNDIRTRLINFGIYT